MKTSARTAVLLAMALAGCTTVDTQPEPPGVVTTDGETDVATLEHGRYLVMISGCNDCHTAGYAESGGQIPEANWLTGAPVGFQGPWGTSYPANLRLVAQQLDEAAWMSRARSQLMPPMPWPALVAMTDEDLSALYQYIHSLGPSGTPAPPYAPPGQAVATPYIVFAPPQNLPSG